MKSVSLFGNINPKIEENQNCLYFENRAFLTTRKDLSYN